jgi:hypothetical protein
LRPVLPQASGDPARIRHVFTAKPEHIGSAGHLLLVAPAIFLRERSRAANKRQRKAQQNSVHSHVRSFSRIRGAHFPHGEQPSIFKMNAARQGSRRTTKCEEFQVVAAHLYIDAAANRSRVLSPWARADVDVSRIGDRGADQIPFQVFQPNAGAFMQRPVSLRYSTLPIFFTAAIRRALSSATNFENSGASM